MADPQSASPEYHAISPIGSDDQSGAPILGPDAVNAELDKLARLYRSQCESYLAAKHEFKAAYDKASDLEENMADNEDKIGQASESLDRQTRLLTSVKGGNFDTALNNESNLGRPVDTADQPAFEKNCPVSLERDIMQTKHYIDRLKRKPHELERNREKARDALCMIADLDMAKWETLEKVRELKKARV
jgi:hypothetical protein